MSPRLTPMKFGAVLACCLATVVAGCGGNSDSDADGDTATGFDGHELIVGCYGGSYGDAIMKAAGEQIESETGATVTILEGNPSDTIQRIMAAPPGNPPADILCTDSVSQSTAVENDLLAPIGDDPVYDQIADIFPATNEGYSPGFNLTFTGVGYRIDNFEDNDLKPIEDWADLWQPGLENRVSFPDISVGSGIRMVLAASDTASGDLYDYEAGIEKMKELEPYSIWTSGTAAQNDLATGNVWAQVMSNGRAYDVIDSGRPVEFVIPKLSDGSRTADLVYMDVVKGTDVEELAHMFQDLAHQKEAQKVMYEEVRYSPTLPDAIEEIRSQSEENAQRLPPAEKFRSYAKIDWPRISGIISDITHLYVRELGQ